MRAIYGVNHVHIIANPLSVPRLKKKTNASFATQIVQTIYTGILPMEFSYLTHYW